MIRKKITNEPGSEPEGGDRPSGVIGKKITGEPGSPDNGPVPAAPAEPGETVPVEAGMSVPAAPGTTSPVEVGRTGAVPAPGTTGPVTAPVATGPIPAAPPAVTEEPVSRAGIVPGERVTGPVKTPVVPGNGPVVPGSGPVIAGSGPVVPGSGPVVAGSGPVVTRGGSSGSAELAGELIALFGSDNIHGVRESFARLNILSVAEGEATVTWLTRLLDSYFTEEQVSGLGAYYHATLSGQLRQQESDQALITALRKENIDWQARQLSLEGLFRAKDDALSEAERKLKNSIPPGALFNYLCDELAPPFTTLRSLLLDDAGDDNPTKFRFLLRLLRPVSDLAELLKRNPRPSEENMEMVSAALTNLLASLSGLHIVNRREVLDGIGRICSDHSDNILFISPESSLVVDPAIHNVKALHGTTVKEGLSYAILRRDSRQTIKLADITVI